MQIRDPEELAIENTQVLYLVQAMIGSISSNMRAVSLECTEGGGVHLHFLLEREDSADREEIEDIIFELEALQGGFINIDVSIVVSPEFEPLAAMRGRRVYGRKD